MKYVFRRNSSVGAMDAESDEQFLRDCFLDTGDLESLIDSDNPKRIVVGRVGAGKALYLRGSWRPSRMPSSFARRHYR
jgi:hypothetical protein